MRGLKGIYLLEIDVGKHITVKVGALGKIDFPKGTYAYVGSAQNGLESRIRRHLRKEKKKHWHVDYLLGNPDVKIKRIWIANMGKNGECDTARLLAKHFQGIPNFGSSDCSCSSHLFHLGDGETIENLLTAHTFREWSP